MTGDAAPAPSPPRIGYCIVQAASLSVFTIVLMVVARYEVIFIQLEMTRLPFPTEVLLMAASWCREYLTVIGIPLIGLILIGLALAGRLDRYLRKLIVINIVWMAIMIPYTFLSLHLPLRQIREVLESK